MTHIATMGAYTCAAFAIAGWGEEHLEMEKAYLKTGKFDEGKGMSLQEWYDDILYPTRQPLGKTKEYPFSLLMEMLDEFENDALGDKYIVAVLAEFQVYDWEDKLKEHGFSLVDKTDNSLGTICHIYTRNNRRVKL